MDSKDASKASLYYFSWMLKLKVLDYLRIFRFLDISSGRLSRPSNLPHDYVCAEMAHTGRLLLFAHTQYPQ